MLILIAWSSSLICTNALYIFLSISFSTSSCIAIVPHSRHCFLLIPDLYCTYRLLQQPSTEERSRLNMKLDITCMRDILLCLEDRLVLTDELEYKFLNLSEISQPLCKFSICDVLFIVACNAFINICCQLICYVFSIQRCYFLLNHNTS